ncbi:putative bifunctional diguanylate cyclase/phosphodiesterase [Glutamicibacter sp. NPDC087344]|uniref:putative bifunctional diguanylate cyclase/phosphodiesterase n=1 Tax=Glutamicibacter sp. NPDC087344 TaxID=3363994 RepID=UPI003815A996
MSGSADDPRIKDLIHAILRTASGDFGSYLAPSTQRDGIDAIIVGFNAMSVRLSELYGQLDEQVARRTELLESASEQLRVLAYSDPLTSLANRAELRRQLDAQLAAISRGEPACTLFVLDLDSFKLINDTHGHHLGDQVLQELTRRMNQVVRDTDVVARLGGDEFALLVHLAGDDAPVFAARLLTELNQPMLLGSIVINPGVSIGYAQADSTMDADLWVQQADTAMYAAKRSRTQKAQPFEPHLLDERLAKSRLIAELRHAVGTQELCPEFLPIAQLSTDQPVAYKAQVRWNHPHHKNLPAEAVISLAQQAGLLAAVRSSMFRGSLDSFVDRRRSAQIAHTSKLHLSVSYQELSAAGFASDLAAELERLEFPPTLLVLEVTEAQSVADHEGGLPSLQQLRELGIELYLDQFGAGYSSLGYLSRLPLSGLILDSSLTEDIGINPTNIAVLRAITDMAATLNLECVAVQVTSESQLQTLRALGVSQARGHHINGSVKQTQSHSSYE